MNVFGCPAKFDVRSNVDRLLEVTGIWNRHQELVVRAGIDRDVDGRAEKRNIPNETADCAGPAGRGRILGNQVRGVQAQKNG